MVKESFVKFTCDTCGKETFENEDSGVPFVKGWLHLDLFTGRTGKETAHKLSEDIGVFGLENKHFCTDKCAYTMIGNVVKNAKSPQAINIGGKSDF